MDSIRPRRTPIKSHRNDWKEELRKNCLRRVRKERVQLLWTFRTDVRQAANEKKNAESAVRNIISDEVQKLKHSMNGSKSKEVDVIWEYQGLQMARPTGTESEDLLLEMERLLYEDLREELIRRELEAFDEEDAYLAQAVLEHMQLNDIQAGQNAELWCPVCKQGVLREVRNLIHCTSCKLRLDLGEDKVNLDYLRSRLANVHIEHLDRGCKATPKFCTQTMFGLTALYIQCPECNIFDIVV